MARAGLTPDLRPRTVTIHHLEVIDWNAADPTRPIATMDVICSAGTYVRALARDLGAATGSAAYLGSLVRTASGDFDIEGALAVDAIREAAAAGPQGVATLLRPVDAGLEWMRAVAIADESVPRLLQGQAVPPPLDRPPEAGGGPVRIQDGRGRLLAIGEISDGRIAPRKVLLRDRTAVPAGDDG